MRAAEMAMENRDKFCARADTQSMARNAHAFPGAVSQGSGRPVDDRQCHGDLAELLLEEGEPLPTPDPNASTADLIELVPLSVHVGASRV
jgi:hypothetical protein